MAIYSSFGWDRITCLPSDLFHSVLWIVNQNSILITERHFRYCRVHTASSFFISHSRGMRGWKEKWAEKLTKNYQRDIPCHRTSSLAIKLGCGKFIWTSHFWTFVSRW